ncbi:dihydrofolate reductase [Hyphomonas sp.]|uniref:dihydrofolate reductase n=1 Tax=Hyphomonas sp. TaxID=87 RepID=UPI0025BF85FE|nr:dihydrofolate reductase [Hyphomonas sp.]
MIEPIRLSLIVAQGRNRVIGSSGQLPWRLKDDLAHFKRTTMGAPVIMGRKTWESLPKRPLPGRPNIVISRDWNYDAAEARVYSSVSPAINAAKAMALRAGQTEVFIIGGAAIYELALPLADRIYLTEVDAAPEGDVFFPALDTASWSESGLTRFEAGEGNDHGFTIKVLDRVTAPA